MTDTSESMYSSSFEANASSVPWRKSRALEFALDTRKFEIELYWKRAAYFWAFSAAAFGAYIAVLGAKEMENRPRALLLVCCLGLVFSTAWYFVNRASKYWQSNWEYHVDMLEDEAMGKIYKTILHDKQSLWAIESSYPFSVSRINQLLSLFVTLIFAVLLSDTLLKHYEITANWALFPTGCVVSTVLFICLFYFKGRIANKNAKVHANVRATTIVNYDSSRSSG